MSKLSLVITICLLYTSDAADERSSVDLGGRRIIKKKKKHEIHGNVGLRHKSTRRAEDINKRVKIKDRKYNKII